MKIHELLNIDVRKLPDEVLNIIYLEFARERASRIQSKKMTNHRIISLNNRSHPIDSSHRKLELERLLSEDWSEIYPDNGSEKQYYVYAHVEPTKRGYKAGGIDFGGLPFYIGKGIGKRAFDLKRNEGHGAELRRLLNVGKKASDIVSIVKEGLSESEALCLEAKLIYFFGTRFDNDKNGVLVNLDKPQTLLRCS